MDLRVRGMAPPDPVPRPEGRVHLYILPMALRIDRLVDSGTRTSGKDRIFGLSVERLLDLRAQASRRIDHHHLDSLEAGNRLAQAAADAQAIFDDFPQAIRVLHF